MAVRRIASFCIILLINLGLYLFYITPLQTKIKAFNGNNEKEFWNENTTELKIHALAQTSTINETFSVYNFLPVTMFPYQYNFTLNPNDLCLSKNSTKVRKLTILILVCTATHNFKQRNAIRKTWGSLMTSKQYEFARLAFLIGATNNMTLQRELETESVQYQDIIQQNFIDSYQNLTLKSIMLLKWVSEFCPNVHYVMKTDDDMYVNVKNLVGIFSRYPLRSKVMYGCLFRKAKPNRNPKSKWFVPKTQFDGDIFPDYLSGTGYVMSRDVVPKLLEASENLPFLVMEDVFITGLCASQCQVKRYNSKGFAYWKRPATGCAFKDVLTGHHVSVSDMIKIWQELQKKDLNCRKVT